MVDNVLHRRRNMQAPIESPGDHKIVQRLRLAQRRGEGALNARLRGLGQLGIGEGPAFYRRLPLRVGGEGRDVEWVPCSFEEVCTAMLGMVPAGRVKGEGRKEKEGRQERVHGEVGEHLTVWALDCMRM